MNNKRNTCYLKLWCSRFLFIYFLFFTTTSFAQQLSISIIENVQHQILGSKILEKALSQINIKTDFIASPSLRAIQLSTSGKVDGEVHRIFQFGEIHKDMIRIPTSYTHMEVVALTKKNHVDISKGWDSLNDYRVGTMKGILYAEMKTRHFKNLHTAIDTTSLYKALDLNRIDIALSTHFEASLALCALGIQAVELKPILEKIPLYFYLHKKNKHLVENIDKHFKKIKKNGELDLIKKTAYLKQWQQMSKQSLDKNNFKCEHLRPPIDINI